MGRWSPPPFRMRRCRWNGAGRSCRSATFAASTLQKTAAKFLEPAGLAPLPAMSLPDALDDAITAAGRSILQLGGYMIFFNLLNLLPRLLLPDSFRYAPLLEISGGLKLLGDRFPLYTLLLLPFGGLSCIAQTGSCIRNTGLSLKSYILHKMVLTVLTAAYYLGWFLLSPDTFLL